MKKLSDLYCNVWYILLSGLLITLLSCNERDSSLNVKVIDNNPPSLNYSFSPANPQNPFDSTGVYHNLGLNAVITWGALSCNEITLKNQIKQCLSSWKMTWGDNSGRDSTYYYNLCTNVVAIYDTNTLDEIVEDYSLNEDAENWIFILKDLMMSYSDSTAINHLIIEIIDWENDVVNSASLNQSTKDYLLKIGSVARYSLAYWYDEFVVQGYNSSWYLGCQINSKYSNGELLDMKKWINNMLQVAYADAAGAAAGAWFGPWGSAIGAAAVSAVRAATLSW